MWERQEARQWHRVKLLLGWRLTVSRHSELWQKCFMRKAGISNMTQSEESVTLMTFYRLFPHGNRSFTFVQDDDWRFPHYSALLSPVILNGRKNAIWEGREAAIWHGVKNLLLGWHLTVFLTTVIDPSHSFRMTFYRESRFYQTKRLLEIRHTKKESSF